MVSGKYRATLESIQKMFPAPRWRHHYSAHCPFPCCGPGSCYRVVGRVTSCARSEAAGATIGLGWLRAVDGTFPTELVAGDAHAAVVPTPFYDPGGARLRA